MNLLPLQESNPCYYRGVIIAVVDPRFDMSEAIVAKRFFNYKDLDSAAAFIRQTCKPQYVDIASVDEVCYHWLDSFTDALVWIGIPNSAISSFLTNNGKEVYTQENRKLSCWRGSFALVGKAGCGDDGKVGKDCDASVQWQFKPH